MAVKPAELARLRHGFLSSPEEIIDEETGYILGLGVDFRAGSFPFSANGRARAMGEAVGLVKILADRRTDRILGMHVIGPMASELIAEGVVAMEPQGR